MGEDIKQFIQYICFGREIAPTTGTPHLQGCIHLKGGDRAELSAMKKILDPVKGTKSGVWCAPQKGSNASVLLYNLKEDVKGYVWGTPFVKAQGSRTDWAAARDACKRVKDIAEFSEEFPELAIKYPSGVEKLISAFKWTKAKEEMAEIVNGTPLNKWQQEIHDLVISLTPLQERRRGRIIWVKDEKGIAGKTHLSKVLDHKNGAMIVRSGKTADIAYQWNAEIIACFDLTRSSEEDSGFIIQPNYQAMEALASGSMTSSKYQSISKQNGGVVVVVFANQAPDWSRISCGRWIGFDLNDGELAPMVDPRIKKTEK